MYRVVHTVGPFQPGEIISAEQAGSDVARLVALGALVSLLGEVPVEMAFATADDIVLPAGVASEDRFQAIEDRLAAIEARLFAVPQTFTTGGPEHLIVGTGLETTGDEQLTTDEPPTTDDKPVKVKGK